jgi:hypothetical protein
MEHLTRRTEQLRTANRVRSALPTNSFAQGQARSIGVQNESALFLVERRVDGQGRFYRLHPIDEASGNEDEPTSTPGRLVDGDKVLQGGTLLVAFPSRDRRLIDAKSVGQRFLRHLVTRLPDGRAQIGRAHV